LGRIATWKSLNGSEVEVKKVARSPRMGTRMRLGFTTRWAHGALILTLWMVCCYPRSREFEFRSLFGIG